MNWFLQNASKRARYAMQNPGYALRTLWRELSLADEKFLSKITNVPASEIRSFLNEPIQNPSFAAVLRGAEEFMKQTEFESADLYAKKILNQYAAVRALKPDLILETGIANGVSSSYLLLALENNRKGKLVSIGLNEQNYLPKGKSLGWVVPEFLKPRWQVCVGDAAKLLPEVLAGISQMDIFIHDSLHTYEHMLWEFETAYPKLRPGGLLFADDALWNPSFPEFSAQVGARYATILRGVGFMQKNPA